MLLTLTSLLKKRIKTHIYKITTTYIHTGQGEFYVLYVTSLANSKIIFTINVLLLIRFGSRTRNLARIYQGVLTVDIIGVKDGQLSPNCFCTLQRP